MVPPDRRHWQQHPGEGASEWVFAARAGQQRSLSPAKTKRKFSLHKSPNFVDFVVVEKKTTNAEWPRKINSRT